MINPGLAPWAMQECRPKGLFLHPTPINSFVVLMCLPRRQRVPHNAMVSLCVFVAIHFVFLWSFTLCFCGKTNHRLAQKVFALTDDNSNKQQQLLRDHCIVRHSLRYFRYSGPVIYMSKLPVPSISMPCDYRILQSLLKDKFYLSFRGPPSGLTSQRSGKLSDGTLQALSR